MPRKSFFAGLLVGVAVVALLAIGARFYELSRARDVVVSVGAVPLPPSGGTVEALGPSNGSDAAPIAASLKPPQPTPPADPPALPLPAKQPAPDAAVPAAGPRTLADTYPVIDLPTLVLDVAFDAKLGRLAVAGPFGESLGVYETSDLTKEPQLVALEGPVASVACKPLDDRRLFIVGLDAPPRLALVDATTLAVTDSIRLATSAPRQLAASLDPADPYIVYLTGPDLKGPRVFELRQLKETASLGQGIVDAALSPDGQRLFYRSSSRNKAVGLFSERRHSGADNAPAFKFESVGNKLGKVSPMYVGPNNLFVAAGKHLLSNDLKKEYATVSFEPQAFLKKQPWMAGVDYARERFCVGSINDYRTVTRIELPKGWLGLPRDAKPIGYRSRELRWDLPVAAYVFADEANEQFLLATPRHLVAIPLAKLDLPAEKTLWSSTTFPENVPIGEPLSIPLEYPGEPDSVSLAKHPSGMLLKGTTLRWTPQDDDFGDHEIEIVAKSGDVERTELHSLRITRPSIEAPFSISGGIDISKDSRRAVVWGEKVDGTATHREFTKIAIVDLVAKTVVVTRTMNKPFSGAILLDENVYVLRRGQLERLSAETLEQVHAEPANGEPETCTPAGREPERRGPPIHPRMPFLTIFGEGHRPWRFDLNTLNRLEEDDEGESSEVEAWENQLAGPTGFGWVSEGVLWNEVTGQPKLLLWPAVFRKTSWEHTLRSSPHSAGEVFLTANTWHPCSHNTDRNRFSSLQSRVLLTTISPELPASLALVQDNDNFCLAALSLIGRRELYKIPLVRKETKPPLGVAPLGIRAEGDAYVVLFQDRLYAGSLREMREAVDEPLHIVPQQSVMTLLSGRPTRVKYVSQDADRFHLESRDLGLDGEWFHAESTTGEFMLSPPESIEGLVGSHVDVIANLEPVRRADNKERLEHYLKPAKAAFVRMLGRPPDEVPIPLRVFVTAENANLERASIAHDFLLEVPRQLVEKILDKKYPLGRDPWKKVDDDSFDPATDKYPDELSPPAGSDRLIAYMRREWTAAREPVATLSEAAKAAKAAGDQRLRKQYLDFISKDNWRTWTDKDGNQLEALFVNQFAGQVVLKTRQNRELILGEARLIEADLQYLVEFENPATPRDTATWRAYVVQHAVRAVTSFHSTEHILPPGALVDDSGRDGDRTTLQELRKPADVGVPAR